MTNAVNRRHPDIARTINGEIHTFPDDTQAPYKFMIWAGDGEAGGGPDTFRIKIWVEDDQAIEWSIYDNGFDQAIGGGSIVVHE